MRFLLAVLILAFFWTLNAQLEEKQCGNSRYYCASYQTCCQQDNGEWGCCPYSGGTCCGSYCCPGGTTCEICAWGNAFLNKFSAKSLIKNLSKPDGLES